VRRPCAERRVEAGGEGGGERTGEGVEQEAPVDADLIGTRQTGGVVVEKRNRARGERDAERGAEDGEQQHLAEQLGHDSAA
jgi:hypothetical protein